MFMSYERLRPTFTFDAERIEQLKAIAPEAFADGAINWEALRSALGDHIEEEGAEAEHFGLFWSGKRASRAIAFTPTKATLVQIAGDGVEEATTQNVFVEGENLEVLKLLQKSYAERVKIIFIDPPYNTGGDFIYSDDYTESATTYLERTGQSDIQGQTLTSNPKTSGRYHSNWLSMMHPRLILARNLLRQDGVIFVSIDDNEMHHLRMLMDEVFGTENFVGCVIWQKIFSPKNSARHFSADHDYILVYARNAETWRPFLLPRSEEMDARYSNPDNDSRGVWASDNFLARNYYSKGEYEVTSPSGKKYRNPTGTYWRVSYEKFLEMERDNRVWWGESGGNMPRLKRFLSEVQQGIVPQTLWKHEEVGNTQEAKKELLDLVQFGETENVLNSLKPTRLIERILQLSTDPASVDIVLDFFAGSGSTAHALLKKNASDGGNRRFICIQFPEPLPRPEPGLNTIADIAKKRITAFIGKSDRDTNSSVDFGFRSFKLVNSHFRVWNDFDGDDISSLQRSFDQFETPLVEGW
jgi:adenine-specific DNA-methyltransferase